MPVSLLRIIAYTLIPVSASAIGGIVAVFWFPGKTLKSIIQHFAAGVVFAAAALELIPKVREQSPWVAIFGFAAGIATMVALRAVTTRLEGSEGMQNSQTYIGLMAVTGVDMFMDGLITGAGFAAGEGTGLLLTLALVLEFLFLSLSIASHLGQQAPKWKIVAAPTGLSLLTMIGAMVGVTVLGGASAAVLAGVLAFGAVALMYLVTEELLVEAHRVEESPWIAATFFIGFLVYLVIVEIVAR